MYEKAAADRPGSSLEAVTLLNPQHTTMMAAFPDSKSTSSRRTREQEISGMNAHTRDVEFYGSSSSVALLSHLQRTGEDEHSDDDTDTLLSKLHNPAFDTSGPQDPQRCRRSKENSDNSIWFPQCRTFIDTFFSTIHYIHPILDKSEFLQQCESLWSSDETEDRRVTSFVALYYSILSLGALVGTRDDELIDGTANLTWSRRFFDRAKSCCNRLGMVTDLEMVQCYFILVCHALRDTTKLESS